MTKIVIADDHRVIASGLRMLLDREEGFEVVAVAGVGGGGLRRAGGLHVGDRRRRRGAV